MKKRAEFVCIPGRLYRCRLRYVSSGGLDALAEFVHGEILRKEQRISVLTDSFGLGPALMEDVLAELVQRGQAVLDPLTGEIRRIDVLSERKLYRLGTTFDVWQDDATGALVPLDQVDRFAEPPTARTKSARLRFRESRYVLDFLEAPDARIISALQAINPSVGAPTEGGLTLDSLVDRERIGPWNAYLPLLEARIEDDRIEFIDAPSLPWWLTRAWSIFWRQQETGRDQTPEDEIAVARATEQMRADPALAGAHGLERGDLRPVLQEWRDTLAELVHQPPAYVGDEEGSSNQLQGDDERRLNGLLQARFAEASGGERQVDIVTAPAAATHLSRMWQAAEADLVVTAGRAEGAWKPVLDQTAASEDREVDLIVLDSRSGDSATLGSAREETIALDRHNGEAAIGLMRRDAAPELGLRDGVELLLGPRGFLQGRGFALRVLSEPVIDAVAARLNQELDVFAPDRGLEHWMARRIGRRSQPPPTEEAGAEAPDDSPTPDQGIELLQEATARLGRARVEYDTNLSEADRALRERHREAERTDRPGQAERDAIDRARKHRKQIHDRPLSHYDAELLELADRVVRVGREIESVSMLEGTPGSALLEALEAAGRQEHDVELVCSSRPLILDEPVGAMAAKKALAVGRLKAIVCRGGRDVAKLVESLTEFAEAHGERFPIEIGTELVPSCVLLDRGGANPLAIFAPIDEPCEVAITIRVSSARIVNEVYEIATGNR